MDPYLLLILVACLFILVFGGLGALRREGLSLQFAVEAIALTLLLVGGSWLLRTPLNPVLFLLILYLITMRSRLIVDLANLLVQRGRPQPAFSLYKLALALLPDASSRLIVLVNQGAAFLHQGQVDPAIAILESVLDKAERPRLGAKNEAACCYNLGYAYELKAEYAKSNAHFHQAIDALPGSVYAQGAQAAIRRRKSKPPDD
jgi:tetratricopeptide (TPR) repeat protein